MASETQYYQAKVFLKAYNEAFSTLEYFINFIIKL